ncbi:bola protein [Phyllosticta citrichinensis]|uniref:Bola protein n=1 Tax=Phyllosticta citrichinensis TaxID=1130410 RepID=A0ABR1XKB2_9PEZI
MAPSRVALRLTGSLGNQLVSRAAATTASRAAPSYLRTTQSAVRSSPFRRVTWRAYSTEAPPTATPDVEPPDYLSEGELHVFRKIKQELDPVRLEVQDISGGCGSMYALYIESPKFKGLTVIKQHKMINEILADEIKSWHGVQLRTKAAA